MTESFAIASFVACAIAVGVFAPAILLSSVKGQRRWLLGLGLAQLPMCALVLWLVRVPLLRPLWRGLLAAFDPAALRALASHDPDALARSPLAASLLAIEAPIAEELGKIGPLLLLLAVPALRDRFLADNARRVPVALAIGLGFGLGEIFVVAHLGASSPAAQGLPWYALTGFIVERVMVCALHGLISTFAVMAVGRGAARAALGVLAAMALHALLNLPIVLKGARAFGLDDGAWTIVIAVWIQVYLVAMLIAVRLIHRRRGGKKRSFLGEVRCPTCKAIYTRPIFGMNLPWARYEACGACGTWQWTTAKDEVDDDALSIESSR